MITEFNQKAVEEEIQIYRNDFYSGIMRLVRKLFML
ncbi:hypothetical protein MTsPCn5_31580 [Croceitalea sp. MTPC5]|nr:hypothetical protein MTsPCn5_31580 [Croceitalea sp. MTPC5]